MGKYYKLKKRRTYYYNFNQQCYEMNYSIPFSFRTVCGTVFKFGPIATSSTHNFQNIVSFSLSLLCLHLKETSKLVILLYLKLYYYTIVTKTKAKFFFIKMSSGLAIKNKIIIFSFIINLTFIS